MTAEQARFLADFFANVFEQESQTTAKVLAAYYQKVDREKK